MSGIAFYLMLGEILLNRVSFVDTDPQNTTMKGHSQRSSVAKIKRNLKMTVF